MKVSLDINGSDANLLVVLSERNFLHRLLFYHDMI